MSSIPADDIESTAVFKERFKAESQDLLVSRTQYAAIIAFFLYPSFLGLDWVTRPDHILWFFDIRLFVMCNYLAGILLLQTAFGRRIAIFISVWLVYVSTLGVTVMTLDLGGFESGYYIGIIFILFIPGLLLPWRLLPTIVCGVMSIATYFGLNFLYGPESAVNLEDTMTPFFFMSGSVVFTAFGNVGKERQRRKDLCMRMQIEKANEDLKELDRAKMRFFSNVSHELRTPLTLILGPLESLLQGKEPADARPLLKAMEANARRLLRQVNTLLDFAKMDAGRLRCNFSRGNLGRLLGELVEAAIPHTERRDIALTLQGADKIPETLLDLEKVETIAANLISNAVKFTPRGGRITVRTGKTKDIVWFEVEDTGIGIPEDRLDSIFERFLQVDDTLSRKSEGTGLGLAMVKELTRIHGGVVGVSSELGKGSVFRVELPVKPELNPLERRKTIGRRRSDLMANERLISQLGAALEEQSRNRAVTLLADVTGGALGETVPVLDERQQAALADAAKILVVEDNSDLRRFLAGSLAAEYRIDTAENGLAALARAKRWKPDLIISDIMMPEMDGYQLCRKVREDPELTDVPIILATAKTGGEAVAEGLDVGANDYVTKPFEMRELRARIRSLLKLKEYNDFMRDHQKVLEEAVNERTLQLRQAFDELKNASEKLKEASLDTIYRLSQAAEYKDQDTGDHIKRMGAYIAVIARQIQMDEEEIEILLYAAPMHDVGKIGIPDHILMKPGRLDDEEWRIMKQHTVIGARILHGSDSEILKTAEIIALTHHEKWDGSGYPNGLRGEDIPLAGRISAVADVFDALTSKRPYKEAFPTEKAFAVISDMRGTSFDPALVDAFFAVKDDILAIRNAPAYIEPPCASRSASSLQSVSGAADGPIQSEK